MQERGITFQDALEFVSKRRPIIFPNIAFQRQLIEFEWLLLLQQQQRVPLRIQKQMKQLLQVGMVDQQESI